jgi:pyridinium-3,5-bisthiocarboxylic acid mononucleotide nickel chelatase
VRMKIARAATGEIVNASPEYEDCRRIAAESNVALKLVMQAAVWAWSSHGDKHP